MAWTASTPVRLIAWTMACCPFAMSVLVHAGGNSVPLAITAPQLPALAFHQYAVDLRKIHPTTEAIAYFAFENRSSNDVRIERIEPSCGCLLPRLQGGRDNIIPAGESGRILLRMQPANSTPGPHEYSVTVHYSDPKPRTVTLSLKLEIPVAMLTVSPPGLIFYHPKGSEPSIADFTVSDGRGKPFEITELSVNTDLVEVTLGESGVSPEGTFQRKVRATVAGDLPPGKSQVLLRIGTSDLDVPEIRVPLLLQGPVPAEAAAVPANEIGEDIQTAEENADAPTP